MARLVVRQDEKWEEQRTKWAGEVGRFVMAFGSIEATTYAALRHLPDNPIAEPLSEAPLMLRLNLLLAIANGHGNGHWAKLAAVLEKIKQVTNRRNLVAHNGLGYDVYENGSGEVFFDEVIRSFKAPRSNGLRPTKVRNDKYKMSFDELEKNRKLAEKLEFELLQVLMDLLRELGEQEAPEREDVE